MNDGSNRFMAEMLEKRERELLAQRRYLPVLLADEHDLRKSDLPVLGMAALCVEGGLAYYFLRNTMMWPLWLAIVVSVSLVSATSLGLKQLLDHYYLKAQDASTAVRHLMFDDQDLTGEKL